MVAENKKFKMKKKKFGFDEKGNVVMLHYLTNNDVPIT